MVRKAWGLGPDPWVRGEKAGGETRQRHPLSSGRETPGRTGDLTRVKRQEVIVGVYSGSFPLQLRASMDEYGGRLRGEHLHGELHKRHLYEMEAKMSSIL